MLLTALRSGALAVRRAGWPTAGLVLVAALPDFIPTSGLPESLQVLLFPISGVLRTVLFLAVIRLLGAHRPEPVPPPPAVGDSGLRVVQRSIVTPVTEADRGVSVALRHAAALGRPALRLFGLSLLATLVAAALAFGLLVANGADASNLDSRDPLLVVPPALLIALLVAFVAVADQRVALEGDPRVLLAAAHSARIAGAAFGTVFGLVLIGAAPGTIGALLPYGVDGLIFQVPRVVLGAVVQLYVVAALNEVYLAGPRADLLVDVPA
ncbi:MAG TPA: hypothetical protein VNB94_05125 [Mycobacteriales bacterium]|nr:hypothetical protein [Mycobacteriales bacterium]